MLLAWLQLNLAGYELGVGNQSIQVPFLLRLHDSALFARDAMVSTTLAAYPSLFYRGLAHALDFVSLPTLYHGLHLLTTAGVFFFILELCRAIFRSYWPGWLTCLFLLAGHQRALAEQLLYSTGFTHTWAVFPLTIAALALLYADRPLAAFALAGFCFNIHALEASQLAFAMLFAVSIRKAVPSLLIFLFLSTPTLWHMLHHREHFDAAWQQLMLIRSGHHSFPFSWWRAGQPDIPRFLLVITLAGLAMSLVPGPHVRKTLRLTAGIALLFIAGILFTEIWPNALVIRAQLFRGSRFLMIIAFAYIAAGCLRARGLEILGAALIVACLAAPPWLVLLPVVVLVVLLLALINRRLLWQQATFAGIALLVTLAAWRTIDFVPVGFSWNFHKPEPGNDPAWIDVQRWANERTRTDALFLTPSQMNGFRVHSHRAVVGEWRDGTQLYFSAAFAKPWWERMQALQPGMRVAPDGKRLLVQGRSLSQLDDAQIIALAKQYSADYVVLASAPRKLKQVYGNEKWTIYQPKLGVPATRPGFFEEVVLPNLDKRKCDVRLQLLNPDGRPLADARYQITKINSAPKRGNPDSDGPWELTDPGLLLPQLSNHVATIRAKYPGIQLGLTVEPLMTSADTPRGLDDVRQLKAFDFVVLRAHKPPGVWAEPKTLYDIFDAFAKEGVRIHFTQFAAPTNGWIEGRPGQWTPALAAEHDRQTHTVALSHPAVDVADDWRTNGVVALDGVVRLRTLPGSYALEVGTNRLSFTINPGTNSVRLTIP